ncbi:MAG: DNA translocase FtsK [Eubacterium sp.]|nr:DNA translocase FtsK [Eubacterium sp.]
MRKVNKKSRSCGTIFLFFLIIVFFVAYWSEITGVAVVLIGVLATYWLIKYIKKDKVQIACVEKADIEEINTEDVEDEKEGREKENVLSIPNVAKEEKIIEQEFDGRKDKEKIVLKSKKINKLQEKNENILYKFPPLEILKSGKYREKDNSNVELKEATLRLQKILYNFGVHANVISACAGLRTMDFEIQPEAGVKISKIVNLSDDIKLNFAVNDIRIEAPISGRAAIGISIPTQDRACVCLRDILESKEFQEFPSNLLFAVGKDISGKIIIADISKMPHLLIAGTTGSGKSVCIDSIIMSIIYKTHPSDVKMIMIDSKGATLSIYNGIPHLLIPVVTNANKASVAVNWAVAEMVDRYKKFKENNVRNLKEYNKKADISYLGEGLKRMPQILIIIDDLSDLMAVNPKETESAIIKLARMSRPVGIHLVIATQRPSTDVITGLMKSSIPSRISFSVFSAIDSRVILDEKGAEMLSGNGDMLFKPLGYPHPVRIQGTYVSNDEIIAVLDFIRDNSIENIIPLENDGCNRQGGNLKTVDEYFIEAGKSIIEQNKASIGMLQRKFRIGFNRAARIMDDLCEVGVVGEEEGTKPRRILMTLEEFEEYIRNNEDFGSF